MGAKMAARLDLVQCSECTTMQPTQCGFVKLVQRPTHNFSTAAGPSVLLLSEWWIGNS